MLSLILNIVSFKCTSLSSTKYSRLDINLAFSINGPLASDETVLIPVVTGSSWINILFENPNMISFLSLGSISQSPGQN